jgi:hypothetical protein
VYTYPHLVLSFAYVYTGIMPHIFSDQVTMLTSPPSPQKDTLRRKKHELNFTTRPMVSRAQHPIEGITATDGHIESVVEKATMSSWSPSAAFISELRAG